MAAAKKSKWSNRMPISSLLWSNNSRSGKVTGGRPRRPIIRPAGYAVTTSNRRRLPRNGRRRVAQANQEPQCDFNRCCGTFWCAPLGWCRRLVRSQPYWVLALATSIILFAIPHLLGVTCPPLLEVGSRPSNSNKRSGGVTFPSSDWDTNGNLQGAHGLSGMVGLDETKFNDVLGPGGGSARPAPQVSLFRLFRFIVVHDNPTGMLPSHCDPRGLSIPFP